MAIFELSSKKYKNGRRHCTATLYELQDPSCVIDDVGTKFNKNGITFLEEYAAKEIESIKDMSVTVEFIDDERTEICAHGDTGVSQEDGMPIFDNATTVGHFTEGYIADVVVNGEVKRCVCGKGYLDEMRYHGFVQNLETKLQNGNSIDGSIEIFKKEGNNAIVYKKGWIPQGRIPTEYMHTGWAMVINPADEASTLLELNNAKKKEDNIKMDEKELKELIRSTLIELNSNNDQFNKQIVELNDQIAEKDNTISELNATVEQVQKALNDLKAEHDTYWSEREVLEKELAKLKAEKRISELNEAISVYTEEELKFAESEINSFKENPLDGDIEAIKSKICVGIVAKQKEEAKVQSEQNSVNDTETIDIFSEVNSVPVVIDEDLNIF